MESNGFTIKENMAPGLIAITFEEQMVLGVKWEERDFLQLWHANFVAQDARTL